VTKEPRRAVDRRGNDDGEFKVNSADGERRAYAASMGVGAARLTRLKFAARRIRGYSRRDRDKGQFSKYARPSSPADCRQTESPFTSRVPPFSMRHNNAGRPLARAARSPRYLRASFSLFECHRLYATRAIKIARLRHLAREWNYGDSHAR